MTNALPFLILALVLACGGSRTDQATPQPTKEPPAKYLNAEVRLSPAGIVVKNTDSVDYSGLTLKINLRDTGSDDGRAYAGSLLQGKTLTIPYGEFTVGTTRFSPKKTKILTVFIKNDAGASKLFLCPGATCQPA